MKQCADSIRVVHPLFQVDGGGSIPTSALQLKISKIYYDKFKVLNELWHSRLPTCTNCFCGVCFGAVFNNIYYAVAWWSHPIAQNRLKNGYNMYELRRLAISDDAPPNTASRMLRIMKNIIKNSMPHIVWLISYQDTDVHQGTIYKAAGWYSKGETKFVSWKNRPGRSDLSAANKVRWECQIRNPISVINEDSKDNTQQTNVVIQESLFE